MLQRNLLPPSGQKVDKASHLRRQVIITFTAVKASNLNI
jgi:hypothetical protein